MAALPLPNDSEEARKLLECRSAMPPPGIPCKAIACAREFILREFPEAGPELEQWSDQELVEFFLDS